MEAIGLFGTVINTPDNVHTIVGNNKIFSETIQNFSVNPYRRVDLTATISNAFDHRDAIRLIKQRLAAVPNVLSSPAPTNRLIREAFGEARYPAPVPAYEVTGMFAGPPLGPASR